MKNSRLDVQTILRSVISEGLAAIGMTGWTVQEFAPSQYISLDKCVLMNFLRAKRLGWQAAIYEGDDEQFSRKDEWLELQSWQLHVIAKRPTETSASSILVEDVTSALAAWINGPGMDHFRSNGVAPERIDEDTILVYNDDNEIYQKRGVFTVKIQVPKELSTEQPEVKHLIPTIEPV